MSTDTLIFFEQYCGKINIIDALNVIINTKGIASLDDSESFCFSPREFSTEEFERILYENLDYNSLRKIDEIRDDLRKLYHNKQLLYVLPILRKVLDEFSEKIVFSNYKPVIITEDNRILISQFNNMEVIFSNLTQAIYILFCQNPNGINIKEFDKYKYKLMEIYFDISEFSDLAIMTNSIEELVSPNNRAIYTHISRIKATLYQVMDKKYADNYIITSDNFGSDYKYIPILKAN
ncbi:hypothetical protein [Elizabethkingia sp. YR214]|uniref:hypothetical protein n=1 Tax=Elizabethkingia TaxID=308865 RepID=UPI000D2FADC1|nr:hypothetical protein [Elizabethkingia sp. YR214]PUB25840.1 hypothetical protein C8J95_1123 [Elizabethkingia sp. YR214]